MQTLQYSPLQIPWKMQALLFKLVLHCCIKLCGLQWGWFLDPIVFQIVNDNIVCTYYAISLSGGRQQKQPWIWYVSFFSVYFCFCVQDADKTTWTETHQLVSLSLWGDTHWHNEFPSPYHHNYIKVKPCNLNLKIKPCASKKESLYTGTNFLGRHKPYRSDLQSDIQ